MEQSEQTTGTQGNNSEPIQAQSVEAPRSKVFAAILLILVSVSAGFLGGWLGAGSRSHNPNAFNSVEQGRQLAEEQSSLISTIAEDVGPSVVSIETTSTQTDTFFGNRVYERRSAGTGFIISEDGYVVTNRHVIPSGTTNVNLILSDGTKLENVKVVGRTNEGDSLDVAFLKIDDAKGKTLVPVKLGDSDAMKVGDLVITIGNALGRFQNTVTSGILSGHGRSVLASSEEGRAETLQNLLQTDAAINRGNSGGPLVNVNGEVIGINTAVAGQGAENIGFAIPINDVKNLINGILEKGEFLRPYLGVVYVPLDPDTAKELGTEIEQGAYILESAENGPSIFPNSPAAKAGLQPRDVIIKINDQNIDTDSNLNSVINRYKVGDTVTITFVRDGQEHTAEATLEAMPQN